MLKKIFMILIIISLLLNLLIVGVFAKNNFRLGLTVSETSIRTTAAHEFAKWVDKLSGGSMHIDIFPSGTLGTWREQIEGLKIGTPDAIFESIGPLEDYTPLGSIEAAAFLYKDQDHFYRIWTSNVAQEFLDEVARQSNIRMLSAVWVGARHIASTIPVRKIEDLKKIKIRVVPTKSHLDFWKKVGANGTPMAFTEVLAGLKTGVIDAVENPLDPLLTMRFVDIAKNVTLTGHMAEPAGILMDETVYQNLPEEQREVIDKANLKMQEWLQTNYKEVENKIKVEMTKEGVTFIKLQDRDEWVNRAEKQDLPKEVLPWVEKFRRID